MQNVAEIWPRFSSPPLGPGKRQCMKKDSNYLYSPAGHVITDNINVIPDPRVRYIISEGL